MNKEPFVAKDATSGLGFFFESKLEGKPFLNSFGKLLFASGPFIRVSLLCWVADFCVSSLNQKQETKLPIKIAATVTGREKKRTEIVGDNKTAKQEMIKNTSKQHV